MHSRDVAEIEDAMRRGVAYTVDDADGQTFVFIEYARLPCGVRMRSYETSRVSPRDPRDYLVWYPCDAASRGGKGASPSPWGAGNPTVNLSRSRHAREAGE
jgi:cysteinyl-tRNA synthetase